MNQAATVDYLCTTMLPRLGFPDNLPLQCDVLGGQLNFGWCCDEVITRTSADMLAQNSSDLGIGLVHIKQVPSCLAMAKVYVGSAPLHTKVACVRR